MNQIEMLNLKQGKIDRLQAIIKSTLFVDVKNDKNRKRNTINARYIYSEVLRKDGFGCSDIGRSICKNHATVLHYWKNFDWLLKSDKTFRETFALISKRYTDDYDYVLDMSYEEIKKEAFTLRIENKKLNSETDRLQLELHSVKESLKVIQEQAQKKIEQEERLNKIYTVIKQRTKNGTEEKVLNKINNLYNGIYDY